MTVVPEWHADNVPGPGLHALIVGISQYQFLPAVGEPGRPEHFKLTSVDGPAVSAYRLAQFLRALPAGASLVRPLKSMRVMLAPTPADCVAEPGLVDWDGKAPSLDALQAVADAWRKDCETSNEEAALFSFTGHGVRFDSDCLVLADFGKGASFGNMSLSRCVTVDALLQSFRGPAAKGTAIARRQFWFVDACRGYVGDSQPGEIGEPSKRLCCKPCPWLAEWVPIGRSRGHVGLQGTPLRGEDRALGGPVVLPLRGELSRSRADDGRARRIG